MSGKVVRLPVPGTAPLVNGAAISVASPPSGRVSADAAQRHERILSAIFGEAR